MQEREVTIGEETFRLPSPFLVLATQNPIEQEGTYPLPEAQVDRFLMKVQVTYPEYDDEIKILSVSSPDSQNDPELKSIFSPSELAELRKLTDGVFCQPSG